MTYNILNNIDTKEVWIDVETVAKLKDVTKRAVGITRRIGTHTLRKTFGYHCYQKYDDVVLLQKIFNHSSPQITLRYIGIEQEDIDAVYRV